MTINAILPMIINYLEFRNIICKLIGESGRNIHILSIQYKDEESGKTIIIGGERKKLIQFYNCFTLKILINDGGTLNFKYFRNGSIQITGCKNIKHVELVILYLVKILNENRDLLKYDKEVIDIKKKQILDKLKVKQLKTIAMEYKIVEIKGVKKDKLIENILTETSYPDTLDVSSKYDISTIDTFDIKYSNIRISMINTCYDILYKDGKRFNIDRKKLYECLQETDINCYYDNTQHQGVKINYMYNNNDIGVCDCKENCLSLSKNKRQCKKITILVFNSGKLIITGANDIKQSKSAYKFINNFINEKSYMIRQISVF